jgi:hypothetical protein
MDVRIGWAKIHSGLFAVTSKFYCAYDSHNYNLTDTGYVKPGFTSLPPNLLFNLVPPANSKRHP